MVNSRYYSHRIIANNSILVPGPGYYTEIIFHSNTTVLSMAEVILPDGGKYNSSSNLTSGYTIQNMTSAIRVVIPGTDRNFPPLNRGIITFRVSDANGAIINLSIGIYTYIPSR